MQVRTKNQRIRLDNADWDDIIPRALLWADGYCKRYFSHIPSAPQPRDLLQQAIADLYSGNRTLPEDQLILPSLLMVMKSIGSNFLEHHQKIIEHQEWFRLHETRKLTAYAEDQSCMLDLEKLGQTLHEDDTVARIFALKKDDPELQARDLSTLLNLSIGDIYNALKRLRRKINLFAQLYQ